MYTYYVYCCEWVCVAKIILWNTDIGLYLPTHVQYEIFKYIQNVKEGIYTFTYFQQYAVNRILLYVCILNVCRMFYDGFAFTPIFFIFYWDYIIIITIIIPSSCQEIIILFTLCVCVCVLFYFFKNVSKPYQRHIKLLLWACYWMRIIIL